MELIDKSALVAEIESKFQKYWKKGEESDVLQDGNAKYWGGVLSCLNEVKTLINTLEVKEVYVSNPRFPHLKDIIDKVFGAGNLEFWEYDDAEQLVLLAKDEVISQICVTAGMEKPYKDGNQWCILKGENIQEGICGFGDNIEDALIDFLRNIPKISLEVKEIDLDDDLDYIKDELDRVVKIYKPGGDFGWGTLYNVATHFFELGMSVSNKAQKGE